MCVCVCVRVRVRERESGREKDSLLIVLVLLEYLHLVQIAVRLNVIAYTRVILQLLVTRHLQHADVVYECLHALLAGVGHGWISALPCRVQEEQVGQVHAQERDARSSGGLHVRPESSLVVIL